MMPQPLGSSTFFGSTTAVYYHFAPTTPKGTSPIYPYIVLSFKSQEQDDAFNVDCIEYMVNVSTYADRTTTSFNAEQRVQAIVNRVYGNAIDVIDRVPQYGLHRHSLVLSRTVGLGGPMQRVDEMDDSDEDFIRNHQVYKVVVSKVYSP